MFIGLLHVSVSFIEMCLCVSFTTQNKIQISKILPDLKHLYLELLCFGFFGMVDCETKSVSFSFPKFSAGGRGISSDSHCCSYVSPVHCMRSKQHYIVSRCFLEGMWTPESSCHCSAWWGAYCKRCNGVIPKLWNWTVCSEWVSSHFQILGKK